MGGVWATFSALFFRASGTLKKGVRERVQNYFCFFVDFGVCPEGLRRVPVSTGAQFSLLQPNPKRAPKREPKSVLGGKVLTILLFVRPCRRNRPSKRGAVFDVISEHVRAGGGARGGLARPEGGDTALDNPPIAWCLYFEAEGEEVVSVCILFL